MWTSRGVSVAASGRAGLGTDHAAGSGYRLGLAIQLVSEALDVVQAVGNDNVIAREDSLYGRIFLRTRILLGFGSVIDSARDTQRLVVDEVHLQAAGARIGTGSGDLGLAVLFELEGSSCLPRGGIA
jgi:hypothetical protein